MKTRHVSLMKSEGRKPREEARAAGLLAPIAQFVCLSLLLAGCKEPVAPKAPEKMLVRTTAVESLESVRSDAEVSYLAMIRAENETDLGFKVGGIVDTIGPNQGTDWDEGTPVKAGTVLAELKQADFINALQSARARADLMEKEIARYRTLVVSRAVSRQELDVTEADWRTAKAQLEQAEQNMRDSRLVAASDGMVLARNVNSHVTVATGQPVLRFAETSVMSVELGLPDRLISRLTPGMEVDVEVSALEGLPPFRGRVSEVGVAASNADRLFRVVIKVPNPDLVLRSGMTARIRLGNMQAFKAGTVRVPLSALVTLSPNAESKAGAAEQIGVFVVQNGMVKQRPVKTGDIVSSSILVSEGLQVGEQVVTSGAGFLYDGAPIDVVPDTFASR